MIYPEIWLKTNTIVANQPFFAGIYSGTKKIRVVYDSDHGNDLIFQTNGIKLALSLGH